MSTQKQILNTIKARLEAEYWEVRLNLDIFTDGARSIPEHTKFTDDVVDFIKRLAELDDNIQAINKIL